jgi:hypothetical protein
MEGSGPQLRVLRAAFFAALCLTLSATSHILLSRTPLPLITAAVVFAGVFTVAYGLGARERCYWTVSSLLVPLELAADAVFTAGQQTCYGPGGGPVTGSWRSLNEALTCHGGSVGGSLTSGVPGAQVALASPWLLLAVHVAVGLLASWVLRCGEASLHRLLRTAFRPLLVAVAFLSAVAVPHLPAPRFRRETAAAPAPAPFLHSVVRRGPPCSVMS